jgi:hypothetical protein
MGWKVSGSESTSYLNGDSSSGHIDPESCLIKQH